jgi:hypothetical protein
MGGMRAEASADHARKAKALQRVDRHLELLASYSTTPPSGYPSVAQRLAAQRACRQAPELAASVQAARIEQAGQVAHAYGKEAAAKVRSAECVLAR